MELVGLSPEIYLLLYYNSGPATNSTGPLTAEVQASTNALATFIRITLYHFECNLKRCTIHLDLSNHLHFFVFSYLSLPQVAYVIEKASDTGAPVVSVELKGSPSTLPYSVPALNFYATKITNSTAVVAYVNAQTNYGISCVTVEITKEFEGIRK